DDNSRRQKMRSNPQSQLPQGLKSRVVTSGLTPISLYYEYKVTEGQIYFVLIWDKGKLLQSAPILHSH
ncbi:MAG: hypothetical protein RSD23_09605, partial [Ruthenibacterium sp.]